MDKHLVEDYLDQLERDGVTGTVVITNNGGFEVEFETKTAPAYKVDIWIAGDYQTAKAACRQFASERGICVKLHACDYIYTGGAEEGVQATLINYPRFPRTYEEVWILGLKLGNFLRLTLHQISFTISDGKLTRWMRFPYEFSKDR